MVLRPAQPQPSPHGVEIQDQFAQHVLAQDQRRSQSAFGRQRPQLQDGGAKPVQPQLAHRHIDRRPASKLRVAAHAIGDQRHREGLGQAQIGEQGGVDDRELRAAVDQGRNASSANLDLDRGRRRPPSRIGQPAAGTAFGVADLRSSPDHVVAQPPGPADAGPQQAQPDQDVASSHAQGHGPCGRPAPATPMSQQSHARSQVCG